MRSLLVLARAILFLLIATTPRLSGAESARVQEWRRLSNDQFETMARGALTGTTAEKPSSIGEIAELCGEISKRGTNARAELHGLAASAIRSMLEDPDLGKHSTLSDGIALWMTVMNDGQTSPLSAPAGETLRKLASLTNDDALKKAFLEVSPAAPQNLAMTDAERHRVRARHSTQRSVVFWLLSDRWIQRELATLQRAQPAPPRCPPFQGTVPKDVEALSPECVEAWKEAARFNAWAPLPRESGTALREGKFKPQVSDIGSPDFEAAVDRFFTAPADLSIAEFSRFYWTSGGWCGVGGGPFHEVRRRMSLMLHLRDRDLPTAVRETLSDGWDPSTSRPGWHSADSWHYGMLELCGLDWEKLFSSGLLPYRDNDPGQIYVSTTTDRLLASRGSNFAGKLLLAAQRWELQWQQGKKSGSAIGGTVRYVNTASIARFITPGDVPPGSRPEIAREIQDQLLQVLIADLPLRKEPDAMGHALITLGRLKRPELKEVIRPYLGSRFHEVADQAAEAMTFLGEHVPRRIHASSGVQFDIYLGDKLWTSAVKESVSIQYKTKAAGWNVSQVLSPYSAYDLAFDHDRVLLAMDDMTEARFVVCPYSERAGLAHPWFSVPLKLPISLEGVTPLRVTTQPVLVRFRHPRPLSELAGQQVELTLEWLDAPKPDNQQRGHAASVTFREAVRAEYAFAALQPGRYRLVVTAPGAARVEAAMEVKLGMKPLELILGRGVTVRARIKLPDFGDQRELPLIANLALNPAPFAREVPIAKLFQDGKEIAQAVLEKESREVSFPHVAPGKYQLRVLSPEDLWEKMPPAFRLQNEVGEPATVAWKRKEIPVEVRGNSPDVLDVGEIELEKVPLAAR